MKHPLVAAVIAGGLLFSGGSVAGGGVPLAGIAAGISVPVTSLRELRFHRVVRQQYDFSCGAAAVATLLRYYYDDPVDERTVFDAMLADADAEVVREQGFSLLDMKHYLDARGYPSDGYRVGLDALLATGIPAIALIDTDGYRHFVVIKGVTAAEVLVGDPALGLQVHRRGDFEAMWNGLLFLVRERMDDAREHFNAAELWAVRSPPPWEQALQLRGLDSLLLNLPRAGDF